MSWLLRHNWLWSLLAFLIGALITWVLLERRTPPPAPESEEPAEQKQEVLVGAGVTDTAPVTRADSTPVARPDSEPVTRVEPQPAVRAQPDVRAEPIVRPEPTPVARPEPAPAFSQLMEAEPTLFDELEPAAMNGDTNATMPQMRAEVPPGRYGEGSADAVPHQAPPDGFTIKGNAQSMLFHTPDSPYYGRTKPEVWFRSESDAERAGFTKYTRRPRKSANPRD